MEISSDEAEDWFMDSLHTYKDLHVFQLESPTKVLEWTGEQSICVAGYTGPKSDILELLLPLKLFAKSNQGLCSERDFKVLHGGFSQEPVRCLTHVGESCVVTSGTSSRLQVWTIGGEDTDVIKNTGFINCPTSTACRTLARGLTADPCVLHGSVLSDVQLTDVSSGKVLYTAGGDSLDVVSGLQFVNTTMFLVCATDGTLYTGDTRAPTLNPQNLLQRYPSGSRWVFALRADGTRPDGDPASCTIARLSSAGQVIVSDLRNPSSAVKRAQLNVKPDLNGDCLKAVWAPALENHLAVSGFDGTVRIFDVAGWSDESQSPQAMFEHRGHGLSCEEEMDGTPLVVTALTWHPNKTRTLLSAASDGSVHVWDWVQKTSDE